MRLLLALLAAALSACATTQPPVSVERIAYQVPLDLTRSMAAVGPGYVDSFTVSCATSATPIRATAGGQLAYTCQNPSTTMVAVGDSTIGDPTDAQSSPVHCATNCPSQEWHGNVRAEYCRADTGTVTIYCRAIVATTTAP